jgi:phage baseplate assembly protein W
MSNLLDRFNKTIAGSRGKYADYVSKIGSSGDFKRIKDIDVILNSWSNILVTPVRTYQFDPLYGSELYKMVFDPQDDITRKAIINEVVSRIQTVDNRASIKSVTVSYLRNRKGFNVTISVLYEGEEKDLKVSLDESTYFKFFETIS